jgi:hypothetical protein
MGFLQLCEPINLHVDLRLKWGLKQSCSPRRELSNGISHVTCTWGNSSDSRLLVVRSQIANLTPEPSFGYNLCFKCLNGSCEPIYVSRSFHWYKEFFNPLSFDLYNCSLKLWESIGTPIPKVEAPLEMWRFIFSHFLTLPRTCGETFGLLSWLVTLQALALFANPKLGLWHYSSYNKGYKCNKFLQS